MNWFRNLKKWQKGGLIGCAAGLAIACLLLYACIVNDTPGGISANEPGGTIKLLILLGHLWLAFISRGEWASLGVVLVIFYGGLGAIEGKIQQSAKPLKKWLLTGLLAFLLLLFYASGFTIGLLSYHP
jgi:hypothetical protein